GRLVIVPVEPGCPPAEPVGLDLLHPGGAFATESLPIGIADANEGRPDHVEATSSAKIARIAGGKDGEFHQHGRKLLSRDSWPERQQGLMQQDCQAARLVKTLAWQFAARVKGQSLDSHRTYLDDYTLLES